MNALATEAVAREPDALAGLVCDLVWDRRGAPRRPLDPMIHVRNRDDADRTLDGIAQDLSPAERRMATAIMIQATHASLVERGILPTGEEGSLAVGRALYCSTMTDPPRLAA
jgi:hypothetical protein